jgi:hypothetical protein
MNDDWATKLIIALDEGFIDKNKVLRKLMSLSTAHKIKLRGMYAGRKPVPFFGKFIITTNEKNFVKLEKEETRFYIKEVPKLKKEDPNIRKKMQAEIPAFLYDIANRDILHPRETRHWFNPAYLTTEIGDEIKSISIGWFEKELNAILRENFYHFKYHTLSYTPKELYTMLNDGYAAARFRRDDIQTQLKEKYGLDNKQHRYDFPLEPESQSTLAKTYEKNGRAYEFHIEKFLPIEQIREDFANDFNIDDILVTRLNPTPLANGTDDALLF